MLKDALAQDLHLMDEATTRLGETALWERGVTLPKIVYWLCVANMHIIQWILRKEKQ